MLNMILSILYAVHFTIGLTFVALSCAIVWLLTAGFDRQLRLLHRWTALSTYHLALAPSLWKCKIKYMDRIDPKKTYVFVANHQSFADIVVLYGIKHDFKWLAKSYLFAVPLLGLILSLNQHIVLKKSASGLKNMRARCRKLLDEGMSVFIFPEGKRSVDGQIGHFHDGAFKIALEQNVEIVPVVVQGTHEVLPKGVLKLDFDRQVQVHILDPVSTPLFEKDTRKLAEHVRLLMQRELAAMQEQSVSVGSVPKLVQTSSI